MANPPTPPYVIADIRRLNALKMSDAEIASVLPIGRSAVSKHRRAMGLPTYDRRFIPTEDQLTELRDASDREMQRRYGVNAATWRRVRSAKGIAPFRNPTTVRGIPTPWVAPKPRVAAQPFVDPFLGTRASLAPMRDHSLAGEAAAFLQRERFHVFNREKIGAGEGWQVGRSVLDTASMIGKALRLGFKQQAWMGG